MIYFLASVELIGAGPSARKDFEEAMMSEGWEKGSSVSAWTKVVSDERAPQVNINPASHALQQIVGFAQTSEARGINVDVMASTGRSVGYGRVFPKNNGGFI